KPDLVPSEEHAGAAELGDGGLEADAGSERRLLKNKAQHPAQENGRANSRFVRLLQLGGLGQKMTGFFGSQIEQVNEVTHFLSPNIPLFMLCGHIQHLAFVSHDCFLEDITPFVELVVRECKGRQEAKHCGVRTVDKQAAL